jgi:hypothetical protein
MYNIGTCICWKGLRIGFHVVPLFSITFHIWMSFTSLFCNYIKIPSVLKGLIAIIPVASSCQRAHSVTANYQALWPESSGIMQENAQL